MNDNLMDLDSMAFVHDNTAITNPTCSYDGFQTVSPKFYGFEIWGTGGNCSAWVKKLDDGYVVLTNDGGLSHELGDTLAPFMMCFYDGSDDETWGECLVCVDLKVGILPD